MTTEVNPTNEQNQQVESLLDYIGQYQPPEGEESRFETRKEYWINMTRLLWKKVQTGELSPEEYCRILGTSKAISDMESRIDALTGLDNRRGFLEEAEILMGEARSKKNPRRCHWICPMGRARISWPIIKEGRSKDV